MRVTYDYKLADYQALCCAASADKRVRRHNLKLGFILPGSLLVFTVFMVLMTGTHLTDHLGMNRTAPAYALAGAGVFILILVAANYLRKAANQQSFFSLLCNANQNVTNELTINGVNFERYEVQGSCGWKNITHITATPTHLFLFLAPLEAFIFPLRAFASPDDFAKATAFAQKHFSGDHADGQTF